MVVYYSAGPGLITDGAGNVYDGSAPIPGLNQGAGPYMAYVDPAGQAGYMATPSYTASNVGYVPPVAVMIPTAGAGGNMRVQQVNLWRRAR